MDLNNQKISGIDVINLSDANNAPLLALIIKNNESTAIPLTNDLIIYINQLATAKQYLFTLNHPLKHYDDVSDEFIMQTVFENNQVTMQAFVKRLIGTDENGSYLLTEAVIEELPYQTITLFAGDNYISTNYQDVSIDLVYPKNNDLNNYFLSNALYHEHNLNNNTISHDDLYFKAAFTKSENGIDINANNLNINCLTSDHDNFNLDAAGNLSVNSITSIVPVSGSINEEQIFNLVYPVGSIYLSINSTNPANYFGGTWVEWGKGRVPVGVDPNQSEFNGIEKTGGHKDLQAHTHAQNAHNHSGNTNTDGNHTHIAKYRFVYEGGTNNYNAASNLGTSTTADLINSSGAHSHYFTTSSTTATNQTTGTGNSGNLQPYITCYMWKRTS